ncbi:MAG: radical SAM family heme chaperone HemW [Cardiobacteriaceae bacterium]|nr:radical SAM family heme chaperone HemW [Cardiobacteriaceae bacterium]
MIPLSLYVHFPWCVRKCPYCDFNSHTLKAPIDEVSYIQHLLEDFRHDYDGRPIHSIFMGGGTPSLFSAQSIKALLAGLRQEADFETDCEITLEANPGTSEQAKFSGYREAGVNRLSIGVQSFDPRQLHILGRIHDTHEAERAIALAMEVGFQRINVDLMFALSEQTPAEALFDIQQAAQYPIEHLSWYQLTLEPNTAFYKNPPPLPDTDTQHDIFEQGSALLRALGFQQYETSAWTRQNPSRHNLNYWQYGDYIGIGAGAHGKQTHNGIITRSHKFPAPARYQSPIGTFKNPYIAQSFTVPKEEQAFEFMMNALRLKEGVLREILEQRTQLSIDELQSALSPLIAQKLMQNDTKRFVTTDLGFAHLNHVIEQFL